MRWLGVVALVSVAGCSLVWDMDPYEGGASASALDGGGASSGSLEGGASSSGGSSGTTTSSSGGSSSGAPSEGFEVDASTFDASSFPIADAGSDASSPPTTCNDQEPNNMEADAIEVVSGSVCGRVSGTDVDWYYADAISREVIGVEFGANVNVVVHYANGTQGSSSTPGGYYVRLEPGENTIVFKSTNGSLGGYAIHRQ